MCFFSFLLMFLYYELQISYNERKTRNIFEIYSCTSSNGICQGRLESGSPTRTWDQKPKIATLSRHFSFWKLFKRRYLFQPLLGGERTPGGTGISLRRSVQAFFYSCLQSSFELNRKISAFTFINYANFCNFRIRVKWKNSKPF